MASRAKVSLMLHNWLCERCYPTELRVPMEEVDPQVGMVFDVPRHLTVRCHHCGFEEDVIQEPYPSLRLHKP